MKTVRIKEKIIGENNPCFIIAEAGVNHNGSLELAKQLIDVAKDSGVDSIKFQTFKADKLVTKDAEKAQYQKKSTTEGSQYEMLKKLELSDEEFEELFSYANEKEIMFLSTPFDVQSADFLEDLGVLAFKIGSGDLTNLPLLEQIATKKKPVILSTGMASLDEVENAVSTITKQGIDDIIILHCITSYPTPVEKINLRAMQTLKQAFEFPVGFSDHTLGLIAPIMAVSLGASVIEKHFTLDKNLPGPDHQASLSPEELKEMVTTIKKVETGLGDGIKRPTREENNIKIVARRSLVAKSDISPGQIINKNMLSIKRPATGIEPKFFRKVIGRKTKRKIRKDESIIWDNLE